MPYAAFGGDVRLPDEVWERINPSPHRGGGLLCSRCTLLALADVCTRDYVDGVPAMIFAVKPEAGRYGGTLQEMERSWRDNAAAVRGVGRALDNRDGAGSGDYDCGFADGRRASAEELAAFLAASAPAAPAGEQGEALATAPAMSLADARKLVEEMFDAVRIGQERPWSIATKARAEQLIDQVLAALTRPAAVLRAPAPAPVEGALREALREAAKMWREDAARAESFGDGTAADALRSLRGNAGSRPRPRGTPMSAQDEERWEDHWDWVIPAVIVARLDPGDQRHVRRLRPHRLPHLPPQPGGTPMSDAQRGALEAPMDRALESDTAVRDADLRGVLTFLMLRHSSLVSCRSDHPHRAAIEAARDSAMREVLWRAAPPVLHCEGGLPGALEALAANGAGIFTNGATCALRSAAMQLRGAPTDVCECGHTRAQHFAHVSADLGDGCNVLVREPPYGLNDPRCPCRSFALAAAPAEAQPPATPHHDGCWREPGHEACARRRLEEMEAQAPVAAEVERDAARWRALLACERIRVLGWARAGEPDMHLSLELWVRHPQDFERGDGAQLLTEFADAVLARQAALAPSEPVATQDDGAEQQLVYGDGLQATVTGGMRITSRTLAQPEVSDG